MTRPLRFLTMLSAGLLAVPALASSPDGSITRINAVPARDGWFLCDAVDGPYALFAGKPDAKGSAVITLLDRRTGKFDTQSYLVGRPDPGAGQIHWPLGRGGVAVGEVHGVNPGMIEDDGATTSPIVEVRLDDRALSCRWLAHTRFIGLEFASQRGGDRNAAGVDLPELRFRQARAGGAARWRAAEQPADAPFARRV